MSFLKFAAAALFALATGPSVAAEQVIVCPSELPADSLKMVKIPSGWTPFITSPLYLHNAAPIAGPPERLGRMIGKTIRKTKDEWIDEYVSLDAPFPEGVWFSCDYGEGNEFSLARKLEAGTTSCVVHGRKGEKAGQYMFDVRCK
jgi:hypothetical protein